MAFVGSVAGFFWGASMCTAFSALTFRPGVPESNLGYLIAPSWIVAGGLSGSAAAFKDDQNRDTGKILVRLGWLLFAVASIPTVLLARFAMLEYRNEGVWIIVPFYAAPLCWGLINVLRGRELIRTLAETPPGGAA
jgi:hypothetical protein